MVVGNAKTPGLADCGCGGKSRGNTMILADNPLDKVKDYFAGQLDAGKDKITDTVKSGVVDGAKQGAKQLAQEHPRTVSASVAIGTIAGAACIAGIFLTGFMIGKN